MTSRNLVGLRVRFDISDPWDLYHLSGDSGILGMVEAVQEGNLLLRLEQPLVIGTASYEWLVCSPRLAIPFLPDLLEGSTVPANGTAIPAQRAEQPFDLSWWRGGGAFTGSLTRMCEG